MAFSTDLRDTAKLADVIGLPAAMMVVAWFGGRTVYVPVTTNDRNHLLCKVAGEEAFTALVERFAGEYLPVPILNMDSLKQAGLVHRLTAKGVSGPDIAQLVGISQNTVWAIRKTLRLEGYPQIADLLPTDENEVNHV